MWTYRCLGTTIASEFELPELEPTAATPDLYLQVKPPLSGTPEPPYGLRAANAHQVSFVERVGELHISAGQKIVLWPSPTADAATLRHYVLGKALGVALLQRGQLVLHGSAVQLERSALALLGPSGQGKSTTAAMLLGRGHTLLGDEHVVLATAIEAAPTTAPAPHIVPPHIVPPHIVPPHIVPGPPCLKLAPDIARQWGLPLHPLTPTLEVHQEQYLRAITNPTDTPVPLAAIYVLETHTAATISIDALSPLGATLACLGDSYGLRLLPALGRQAHHFQQLTQLCLQIPVFRLSRPHDPQRLPELAEKIEAHLRKLPPQGPTFTESAH